MKARILSLLMIVVLSACKGGQNEQADDVLIVGTVSGPDVILLDTAKAQAKTLYDMDFNIVAFEDYTLPNIALGDGTLDANMFQHEPYLEAFLDAHPEYNLVVIGKTFVYPMGIYSTQITDINAIEDNSQVAIPSDPSNGARALLLLQSAGLLTLNAEQGIEVTVQDIIDNPKGIRIIELDAAQLPRTLADVAVAVINNNFATEATLPMNTHTLFIEGPDSIYANIIVARQDKVDDPRMTILVDALHSDAVIEQAQHLFPGAIPAW